MRLSVTLLLFVITASVTMSAQLGFAGLDGLPTALERAQDSIGADAQLVLLGTGGGIEGTPIPIEFDIDDGSAPVWAYVFRSESEDAIGTVLVVRLFGFQAFLLGDTPFPLPQVLQQVTTDGDYANSPKMVAQLKTNATFQQYQSDRPDASPSLVILGQLLGQDVPLPDGFPLAAPIWTVTYTGDGDAAMTCFVASESGQTFCLRSNQSTSVAEDAATGTTGAAALWLQ